MPLRPESASDLLIDGKLTPGSGGVFDVVNPATEEVIGQAADATAADMDAAIAAARTAFASSVTGGGGGVQRWPGRRCR